MTLAAYTIDATWTPRLESPKALATRFQTLLDRLNGLHPAFRNWLWCGDSPIPFEAVNGELSRAIEAGVSVDDWGNPDPRRGYWASVVNEIKISPRSVSIQTHGGGQSSLINMATLKTGWRVVPEASLVSYEVLKPALMAIAETYDPDVCSAYPTDLMDLWPSNRRYRCAWMWYIKPDWAPLITPPLTAIVEHRPNGGLFMAATEETFRTQNPEHLAVAQDIVAALAPLGAMPDGWAARRRPGNAT